MWKFLLGAAVVFLYYNQATIRRGYYILKREFNIVVTEKPRHFNTLAQQTSFEAPPLDTTIEVKEPSLKQLKALGINVR